MQTIVQKEKNIFFIFFWFVALSYIAVLTGCDKHSSSSANTVNTSSTQSSPSAGMEKTLVEIGMDEGQVILILGRPSEKKTRRQIRKESAELGVAAMSYGDMVWYYNECYVEFTDGVVVSVTLRD